MGMEWLVGLLRVGPVCGRVPLLVGFVAIVRCPYMFGFLFWFGVAGGRPQLPGCWILF